MTAVFVGAGTAVALAWWFWTRRQKEEPPKKWRKVGELSDLVVFPVKSLGPVRLNTMECTPLGLRDGWLRDRILMVIDMNGQFITGRQLPRMVQVIFRIDTWTARSHSAIITLEVLLGFAFYFLNQDFLDFWISIRRKSYEYENKCIAFRPYLFLVILNLERFFIII